MPATIHRSKKNEGVALIITLSAIAILTVLLTDLHQTTSVSFAISESEKDRLQAEYIAKSGLNLTRLLVAQEPQLRALVAPIYQGLLGRPPPQLPVWGYANMVLQPFCNYEAMKEGASTSFSLASVQGLGDLPGRCEITAVAENSKINVNDPLQLDGEDAAKSIAMQLFTLFDGYRTQSPYDRLFSQRDATGLFSSRLDVISAMVDWWDIDTEKTVFNPGAREVTIGGAEDDVYNRFVDPYKSKNAPFDSLEELRLVRGVNDDFWATFVDPNPADLQARRITVYGSGAINPNEAPPEVLLSRLCSFLETTTLCSDPLEASKFTQLFLTARSALPLPAFSTPGDFLNFVEGKGGPQDLYPMLQGFLGEENPLLFAPIIIPQEQRTDLERAFGIGANIITLQSEGFVGRSRVRLRAVVNFDRRWTPPPPNAGSTQALGVFQHYRID